MSAKKLNVVIPMAGRGSRFAQAGYSLPKPLLPVHGSPMIEVVIKNLTPKDWVTRFIFICQKEHLEHPGLVDVLKASSPEVDIIPIEHVTQGAACTVLLAKDYICNETPLMIANCDQFVSCDMDDYLRFMDTKNYDGLIMTMKANDPKWSYVKLDESGLVRDVVEKKVVSQEATVGIYNYRLGSDFVYAAEAMIENRDVVNGEYYVAPAYNYMIKKNAAIGFYNIGSERDGMYGLGIPEDLEYFNALPRLPYP